MDEPRPVPPPPEARIGPEWESVSGKCNGVKRQPPWGLCRRPAGSGTDHVGVGRCKVHGGKTPSHTAQAVVLRRTALLAEVTAELVSLGRAIDVDPAEAMLAMVHEAAGNVAFLRMRVQELEQVAGTGGIAGLTGSESKLNEAAPHVLVAMYDAERERLVRWAKMCRDAGVEEHRVQLAEREAEVLVGSFRVILEGLRLRLLEDGVEAALVARLWDTAVPGIVSRALEAASVEARS